MLDTAIEIAIAAGDLARQMQQSATPEQKPDGTWATSADCACEELIRERLKKTFPAHRVYGEEFGGDAAFQADHTWLVDPIDGTLNYAFGLPLWGVSLGVLQRGRLLAGVFFMPLTNQLFTAQVGAGAYLNGRRVRPRRVAPLDQHALIGFNSPALEALQLRARGPAPKVRNLGCTAAHACYVACGALTAAVCDQWALYDLAAGLCLALEVGLTAYQIETGIELRDLRGVDPGVKFGPMVLGRKRTVRSLLAILERKR